MSLSYLDGYRRYVTRYIILVSTIYALSIPHIISNFINWANGERNHGTDTCVTIFNFEVLTSIWRISEITCLRKYFTKKRRSLNSFVDKELDRKVSALPLIDQNWGERVFIDAVTNTLLGLNMVFEKMEKVGS